MTPVTQQSPKYRTFSAHESLSPAQAKVVVAFARGTNISAAAREVGVSRGTIHQWLRDQPGFKAAAEAARSEHARFLRNQLRELTSSALGTLAALLDNPKSVSPARLQTALAILGCSDLA